MRSPELERALGNVANQSLAVLKAGKVTAETLRSSAKAARYQFKAAVAKHREWCAQVFRGDIPFDESFEASFKSHFATLIELMATVEAQAKEAAARNEILMSASSHRALLACRDNAEAFVKNWTSPKLSISPSLRSRKISPEAMEAIKMRLP